MKSRCPGVFLIVGFIGLAVACERRVTDLLGPSSPRLPSATAGAVSDTAGSADAARGAAVAVALCHRTHGANPWILIGVPAPALDAHLQHGDARVGDPMPGQPGMKFGSDCEPVERVPVTITFAGFLTNGTPVSSYTESEFTVVSAIGNWEALSTYGHPAPSLIFKVFTPEPLTAEVKVTAGGAVFSFASVDLYSSVTPIPYVFSGTMRSSPVFTAAGTQPNTYGTFATVPNSHSTDMIDTLSISLTNPALSFCVPGSTGVCNAMGLDNVVLTR